MLSDVCAELVEQLEAIAMKMRLDSNHYSSKEFSYSRDNIGEFDAAMVQLGVVINRLKWLRQDLDKLPSKDGH